MIQRLEEIRSWQLAKELNQDVFILISRSSFNKDFALKDQINRSAGSIMDNIAEGFGRVGNKEFIQFLSYSKGSCVELKSQLHRAKDRHHINESEFEMLYDKVDHIEKMNLKLIIHLKNSEFKGLKFKKEKNQTSNPVF